ncbi:MULTISPECIES: helix-turn-helix transcriptional regulator [unclassified Micromonospora]|uniref:helix-turn-helix domain-containing protein n=1 Tax=unclassified Micromonospora TaxID=2617518 RepID=UPI001C23FF22|nr:MULTISPECIES: helix-turn-helix transcriptional regulator [unclassified Micromonospora]MBU8859652.1 helix-turn-helix transcriptional regulator [Micromonospora sp. WMMB482]MDM4779168.1 helix-turn-helix transcriptional regulator [Micromonospora sp. b486]
MTQQPHGSAGYDTDSFAEIAPRSRGLHSDRIASWAAETNQTIATQIRNWRNVRGLSAQQLSERCASIGYPIPRNIIANIETGRRGSITVPEVIIIAMALNVPPILLIYPVGKELAVRTSPRQDCGTFYAARWFMGDTRPTPDMAGLDEPDDYKSAVLEWESARDIVQTYQRHGTLVRRYRYVREDVMAQLTRIADPAAADEEPEVRRIHKRRTDVLVSNLSRAGEALRNHRTLMKKLSLALPALPPDIELTDDPDAYEADSS